MKCEHKKCEPADVDDEQGPINRTKHARLEARYAASTGAHCFLYSNRPLTAFVLAIRGARAPVFALRPSTRPLRSRSVLAPLSVYDALVWGYEQNDKETGYAVSTGASLLFFTAVFVF